MKVIILLGPPGSGKGTQARLLRDKFNLEYIGSGDLLRARTKKDDFTGSKLDKVIDAGERAPTFLISRMWMEKFKKFKHHQDLNGFIMDGSPRRVIEARLVDEAFDWYEWSQYLKVLFIDISKQESVNRLLHRRICKECGKVFPYTEQYKDLEKCDRCGGELKTRADDTKAGIEERWDWFKEEVKPVIDYYKKKKVLVEIDGEQSIEEVHQDIIKSVTSNQ